MYYKFFKIFLELFRSNPIISPKLFHRKVRYLPEILEKIFNNFREIIILKFLKNFLNIFEKLFLVLQKIFYKKC